MSRAIKVEVKVKGDDRGIPNPCPLHQKNLEAIKEWLG